MALLLEQGVVGTKDSHEEEHGASVQGEHGRSNLGAGRPLLVHPHSILVISHLGSTVCTTLAMSQQASIHALSCVLA